MLPITAFTSSDGKALSEDQIPVFSNSWEIAVMYGPHGAPDFFTKTTLILSLLTSLKFTLTQAVPVSV